jgi:transposase InsO family protein
MEENQPIEKRRGTPPRGGARGRKKSGRRYAFEIKLRAVKLHLEEGFSVPLVCQEMGVSLASVHHWLSVYKAHGSEGLRSMHSGTTAERLPRPVSQKITELKQENPSFGIKRISQVLRSWFHLKASPETVRRKLKGQGLIEPRPKPRRNLNRPRFFERATPNQMWQSDIFTFKLGGRWAYLIGFMDDYSRFITGAGLYHSQTCENVLEVFRSAIAEYRPPKEMLTDNGRQYATWRGKSRFQKELEKEAIHHIRSSPHHPMTLGKIERFWATLWQEFLTRAQFESFESARERIRFWIQHYNHRRPNQGIEGLCPADRFFEVATEVRKTIEAGIQDNLLEMALRGKPRAPFYMVGRMEGQSVVLRAEKGKLKLSIDNGNENKELVYDLKPSDQSPLPPAGQPPHGHGESPGGPGGVDGALQSGGGLSAAQDQLHDLPALAAPSHGGDAPGAGVAGQPGQGGGPEPTAASPLGQPSAASQHPSALRAAGADPACKTSANPENSRVDDTPTEASQSHSASASGSDHGPGGSRSVGHLPSGLLSMGETRPQRPSPSPGGTVQGTPETANGPGEEKVTEPGEGTGRQGAPV